MQTEHIRNSLKPFLAMLANIGIAYAVYIAATVVFYFQNYSIFQGKMDGAAMWEAFLGSLYFDTSAIAYTCSLYVLMMLFPLHLKETPLFHKICRWVFVVVNAVALVMNLADSVYFPFTLRRTTMAVFKEFGNDGNVAGVIGSEILSRWYLVLIGALIIYLMYRCYVDYRLPKTEIRRAYYYPVMTVGLGIAAYLTVGGIRGGFAHYTRPITISNANQFVAGPTEAALVLNTPFSMIRTIGKDAFEVPQYFESMEEVEKIFSPIHNADGGEKDSAATTSEKGSAAPADEKGSAATADSLSLQKRNVMVLIMESFGREYVGYLNKGLDGGRYKGYTTFLDSLAEHCATFEYSFANGRKSIDGMPSVMTSIPAFSIPVFLSTASLNDFSGLADVLGREGYETAFFHGAPHGSMGFEAFARTTHFQRYFSGEEYEADARFGGHADFDGWWGIWDEPFLQFSCTKISEMKEPFMTALFSVSSHHPFNVPEKYKDIYKEEGDNPIHKCIRYSDNALRRFFESARKEPWFENTIFVITNDHHNQADHDYYRTDLGGFSSTLIIYDPQNDSIAGMHPQIAQQIDIMPTVLGMLGYRKPFFSYGKDLFRTAPEDSWAICYLNGIYQYVKHGSVMLFDGEKTTAIYSLADSLMRRDIKESFPQRKTMEREVKAMIQDYMWRMSNNKLTAGK